MATRDDGLTRRRSIGAFAKFTAVYAILLVAGLFASTIHEYPSLLTASFVLAGGLPFLLVASVVTPAFTYRTRGWWSLLPFGIALCCVGLLIPTGRAANP